MNEIMIFTSTEFGEIRTLKENNKVLFCGSDITKALGYGNASAALNRHCKGITKRDTLTNGGIQALLFITEGDVYRLIAHSRLPSAERFESWIFDEVLPTIRKTGGYVANEDVFVETYLPFADEPIKQLFRIQCRVINQLNERIRKDEPKVKFADHVSDSTNLIDVNKMAKLCADHGIRIGRNRLFAWMRARGILMGGNIPYQEYIENGYFRVKESVYESNGQTRTYQQTFVTGKGQQYILSRLMKEYGGVMSA
ncbi:MAG TPA: phage antirepressor KilAC domain-containing protein [Ruminococcus flavefaciens]|nr:phage antirepressor KilAC domain-containing protein [Ruminococcus flavefaciens]